MGIYAIGKSGPKEYAKKTVGKEKHIEDFLEKNIRVLDPGIFVIGRQVRTDGNNSIDLMGMDREGNTVIIELKRDMTARQVISQALDYAVWVEGADYDTLNNIAKKSHLGKNSDLYGLFQSKFGSVPEPWNDNQKIYIVAERIDEKTGEIALYLRRREVDIRCAELNFYEGAGEDIVNVNFVVGDPSDTIDVMGEKTILTWDDVIKNATDENRSAVSDLITAVQTKLKPLTNPRGKFYHMKVSGKEKKNKFATIACQKKSAYVIFRVDPDTFEHDENPEILPGYKWFFPEGEAKRQISITKSNVELILQCLEHAHAVVSRL